MTGFGRAANQSSLATGEPVELEVSVRTVNGRYLEIRTHLPREYASLESTIKTLLAKTFSRGTVDVYVNRGRGSGAAEVTVNPELAEKYMSAYRKLSEDLGVQFQPTLELLTKWPDVVRLEERSEVGDLEKTLVQQLVSEAAAICGAERAREGAGLKAELDSLCTRLEELAEQMLSSRLEANTELDRKLRERLQKLGFDGVVDDQRIAQEIVLQLDRSDISEELTRLREHVKAYRSLIQSTKPEGKKLDFYAQELLREVNTIGSKSQVLKLTALVVDAKTLVEKIREQVQNIE